MRAHLLIISGLLVLLSHQAAASSCVLDKLRTIFVNPRARAYSKVAQIPLQQQAIEALREARMYRKIYYEIAQKLESPLQRDLLLELLEKKNYEPSLWKAIPQVTSEFQARAFRDLAFGSPRRDQALLVYVPQIADGRQLEVFLGLTGKGEKEGFNFWKVFHEKRIEEAFHQLIRPSDVEEFTRWDGFDTSATASFSALLRRYSSKKDVKALVEFLPDKKRYVLKDGQFYAEIVVERQDDRLRIAVPAINVRDNEVGYGNARAKSINGDVAKFTAALMLLGLHEAKRHPEIREVEFLAQNIVNNSLTAALGSRGFHRTTTKKIPNYSHFHRSGQYLRLSVFPPVSPAPELTYGAMTLELFKNRNVDIQPMRDAIAKIDNVHQFRAIRELLLKGYVVTHQIDRILNIRNAFQVRALQAVVDTNQELDSKLFEIVAIESEGDLVAFFEKKGLK